MHNRNLTKNLSYYSSEFRKDANLLIIVYEKNFPAFD